MKQIKCLFIVLALLICGNVCLAADNDDDGGGLDGTQYKYEGLLYRLDEDTREATVDNGNNWNGVLTIPSKIVYEGEEYTVTYIGWLAFDGCETLTKVVIPKTVKDIIHYARWEACKNPFNGSTNLMNIEVAEDNPWMCSVGGVLFDKEQTFLYCYPAGSSRTSYTIPDGIRTIGLDAFAYASNLIEVNVPSSVTLMWGGTFRGCKKLERTNIPEIKYVSAYMFRDCEKLQSVEIPSSARGIEEQVFWGCSSLKVIDIPSSVEHIGSIAFGECNLDAIVIRGIITQYLTKAIFERMNTSPILYVPSSQIDKYKEIYTGTVLPLEAYYPTGIQKTLNEKSTMSSFYDLSGRRLSKEPQKGVYIRDGKKVVIK